MSKAPCGSPRPRLGHAKRHGLTLPVSGPFPQPLQDLPRAELGSTAPWFFVTGELRGGQVLVRKSGDIAILTSMGFFGINLHAQRREAKQSFSRQSTAAAAAEEEEEEEGESASNSDSEVDEPSAAKRSRLEEDVAEFSGASAPLVLSSYEAFFLAHSVAMLRIFPPDSTSETLPLSIADLWSLFCSRCRVFPYHYAVYLFYRAKGWVPKHGLRVGAHFTLYPQGPPFFHAEYSVRVQVLRSDTLTRVQLTGSPALTSMKDVMTLHRVTNKVDKKLVLCYVIVPENLIDITSPSVLHSLKVKEVIVERFHPQRP